MINLTEYRNHVLAIGLAIALLGLALLNVQCTKQQTSEAITSGASVADVICAVLLEPDGTEREICDTGTKLARLLAELLAPGAPKQASSPAPVAAPSVSGIPSAAPAASAAPVEQKDAARPRLVRLYVQSSDAGTSPDAGVDSPGIGPG